MDKMRCESRLFRAAYTILEKNVPVPHAVLTTIHFSISATNPEALFDRRRAGQTLSFRLEPKA